MPPHHSDIRSATEAYLTRHPEERDTLAGLLATLDGVTDPCDPRTLPGHISCSAVVVDRDRRVLHLAPEAGGTFRTPGGHARAEDRTLLGAALRELRERTGVTASELCLTPRLLDTPLNIEVYDVPADPAAGEPAHRHYDFHFAFHLAHDHHPALKLPDRAGGAEWQPTAWVAAPLRDELLGSGIDGRTEPGEASALIHDGTGRYLLHLRDDVEGIRQPGAFALLGCGREPGDASLEATVLRELAEEAPGLEPAGLVPYGVRMEPGAHGLMVPIQVYEGRWHGDPDSVELRKGVLLRWFAPDTLDRLRMSPDLRDLIRRHALDRRAPGRSASPSGGRVTGTSEEGASAAGGGRVWLPPEQYAETVLKATAFACVYFTDEEDRPLQLRSTYSPSHPWQLVGGTMDPGERPWETAVRECVEETGITVSGPPRLLATVFGLPGAAWPYSTVGLVFDGGRLSAERIRGIVLDPHEHDGVRVLPLKEWEALMPPRDFARLGAVAEARRTGVAAYFDVWDWED
uniref:NUDIX domain-containing protein n=1 Tax=Streptomyces corallincola TaxID=2851888 RepID=UPI001FE27605|nr:NUDIX hydrolase [Streptomyces corallincola]